MATKKENIKHQLKSELYGQYYSSKGKSRHSEKMKRGQYNHHDSIYSRNSLKTHISRSNQFANWLKQAHPEVRQINAISREIAGQYLQIQQEKGYTTRTIEADMTMLNHIQIGRENWTQDEKLTKKEFDIKPRNKEDIINNRGTKATKPYNENQQQIIEFGKAFGLRRSELVPDRQNNGYAVTTQSLFLQNDKIYLAAIGKGARFRTIECLESRQDYIKEEYGQYLQKVDQLPNIDEFKESYNRQNQLFNSISNNVRIHVECRQYYANQKINELESSERHFQLLPQNCLKSGVETYTTNGREMARDHAQFVSQQLGHSRIYELKSYVNVN